MWQKLSNPPVVMALFQMKLKGIDIKKFLEYDIAIKKVLPNRHDNIQVGLNFDSSAIPLGKTKISGTSNAEIGSYIYYSNDNMKKFEISADTLTYIDETKYNGWESFKKDVLTILNVLEVLLNDITIQRTSIRFINRFSFPDFNNPNDYVNTIITEASGKEDLYPIRQYGFRIVMDVPNTDIYSIVNHNVENIQEKTYLYTFDIDVLDRQQLLFNKDTISDNIEKLRNIKNKIFFETLTPKTIELCN